MKDTLTIKEVCINCDNCRMICPVNAIIKVDDHYHIDEWACHNCNICLEICPARAIKIAPHE